ncbi:hypothetical protein [Sporisorium scitamineum]|uniref:Uncharacterized protein n=1 Tax=Sporisorium scitamineum TaxID=49012 RepID=A0A0F7RUR8_9BASI|nr:hypothetical protein [Sporisorium scitamineum]
MLLEFWVNAISSIYSFGAPSMAANFGILSSSLASATTTLHLLCAIYNSAPSYLLLEA